MRGWTSIASSFLDRDEVQQTMAREERREGKKNGRATETESTLMAQVVNRVPWGIWKD
jgi:hypothetical protein